MWQAPDPALCVLRSVPGGRAHISADKIKTPARHVHTSMPRICYEPANPILKNPARLGVVHKANQVVREYQAQGFDLTLRQLYYQFVSRGWLANKDVEYKRLGDIITDARLAGLIDWLAIVDRTRNLKGITHWESPQALVATAAEGFAYDKWALQPVRVEVWIEKDALAGVFSGVCRSLDVPYFSCRGYTSASEMWVAGRRLRSYAKHAQQIPVILHFGDHDPSGMDMTRDITERLQLFAARPVKVIRMALNMSQVERYSPPPNPAKVTDGRAAKYIAEYGTSSWELDALEPAVLARLVTRQVKALRDETLWKEALAREAEAQQQLKMVARGWDGIVAGLKGGPARGSDGGGDA